MKKYNYIVALATLFMAWITVPASAQFDRNWALVKSMLIGLEYQVKAGVNIGGTAPLPLPVEIRQIESYNPTLALAIEGNVTKWMDPKREWGLRLGVRLENKAMKTDARVKNYSMEIIGDGGEKIKGNWTGNVKTEVDNTYLSIPVLVTHRFNDRFTMSAGPYVAFMFDGKFIGDVYEGYLREGDPTGNKVIFEDEASAPYNFSDDLRKFNCGVQLGAEWRAFNHLNVFGDLTWGLNGIFPKDFETMTFALYPIYLNVGFGYVF